MKKIAFALAAAAALFASAETKIGLVNMSELIRLNPDYPRDTKAISEKRQSYEEELLKMQNELETLGASLQKQAEALKTPNPMLTPNHPEIQMQRTKFEEDQKVFATRRQQLLLKTQEYDNMLNELRSMLSKRAAEKVRENLAKFAKAKGYDMLLDVDSAAWARDGLDVTKEVLEFCGIDAEEARKAAADAESEARRRTGSAAKAAAGSPAAK